MKKIVIAFCLAILVLSVLVLIRKPTKKVSNYPVKKPTSSINLKITLQPFLTSSGTSSIFVPYWNLTNLSQLVNYDRIIYFGLNPSVNGVNKQDSGYYGLATLMKELPGAKDIYITLQLFDNDTSKAVLTDTQSQQKLIDDVIDIVNQYKIRGVMLDLELNDIFDGSNKDNINSFVQGFYTALKNNNSRFSIALYGDLFYRKRPYDISTLAQNSDEIIVMAYDFHKAGGEPGPNFQLSGRDTYGYDFQEMVDDFLQIAPPNRLSIVFGMYGYEWEVDDRKRPLKPARALSYLDIKKQYLDSCTWRDCLVRRDDQSAEMEIEYVSDYTDPNPVTNPDHLITPLGHIVWFEDQTSVGKKIEYLKSKGIGNVAYWVWGYF